MWFKVGPGRMALYGPAATDYYAAGRFAICNFIIITMKDSSQIIRSTNCFIEPNEAKWFEGVAVPMGHHSLSGYRVRGRGDP